MTIDPCMLKKILIAAAAAAAGGGAGWYAKKATGAAVGAVGAGIVGYLLAPGCEVEPVPSELPPGVSIPPTVAPLPPSVSVSPLLSSISVKPRLNVVPVTRVSVPTCPSGQQWNAARQSCIEFVR